MQTLKIEVSNSIYEHIIFFLQSLPKNLINISYEIEPTSIHTKQTPTQSQKGIFQSYADSKKQLLEKDAWKNHVLEKYRSGIND
ncbi:MAG TPA: hypothetical protein EYG80_04540 [Flavobacteriaceae bacterium]|nr:hypothetical protein [Flavobacteriaceae bacterium]